jgi:hypothetical protein
MSPYVSSVHWRSEQCAHGCQLSWSPDYEGEMMEQSVGVEPPWLSWWNFSVVPVFKSNIFEQWFDWWKISWVRWDHDLSLRMIKECNINQFGSLMNLPLLVTLPTSILSLSSFSCTVKYCWANCRANSVCHTSGTRELAFHLCPLFIPLQWGLSPYQYPCEHWYTHQYHTNRNNIECWTRIDIDAKWLSNTILTPIPKAIILTTQLWPDLKNTFWTRSKQPSTYFITIPTHHICIPNQHKSTSTGQVNNQNTNRLSQSQTKHQHHHSSLLPTFFPFLFTIAQTLKYVYCR